MTHHGISIPQKAYLAHFAAIRYANSGSFAPTSSSRHVVVSVTSSTRRLQGLEPETERQHILQVTSDLRSPQRCISWWRELFSLALINKAYETHAYGGGAKTCTGNICKSIKQAQVGTGEPWRLAYSSLFSILGCGHPSVRQFARASRFIMVGWLELLAESISCHWSVEGLVSPQRIRPMD